ncbi:MAG: proline/glycine betaine ABC transporter permease [Proteobacteria bacterium]|nr:proline/glycine betaine ABC transporter permease [Pseudomonadota bacterium]
MENIPKLPLDHWIDDGLDFLTDNFAFLTKIISRHLEDTIDYIVESMMYFPPWVMIILFAAIAWRLADYKVGIFTIFGLGLLWNLRLWESTMETLTLVIVATFIAIAIAIPMGIFAAISKLANRIIMPLMDLMQTMPAFVYLIPAIPFFGLGTVSAIFSTVIFAMPPAIRLTCLGIKQVSPELVEAADAFGATKVQKLFKVQLPLAIPTIMAGINQTIMLALSMVVIAAMIGAGGLGGEVWTAIQRLKPGMGFQAGIAIVILAIILDRITQKIGRGGK